MQEQRRDWMAKQREKLGLSQAEMGERFPVPEARISLWERGTTGVRLNNQRAIAKNYELPLDAVLARFRSEKQGGLTGNSDVELDPPTDPTTLAVSPMEGTMAPRASSVPPSRELKNTDFLPWVERHSAMSFREAYDRVLALVHELESEPSAVRLGKSHARGRVSRTDISQALRAFYGEDDRFYRARVAGELLQVGLLVTGREQVDVNIPFNMAADHVSLVAAGTQDTVGTVDGVALESALRRLAEVELARTVLVDRPLYRLQDFEFRKNNWRAVLSESDFLSFALTNDLLEGELVGALAEGKPVSSSSLPLRSRYLPTVDSALDFEHRCCVGGVAGLLAVARKDPDDYLLLVQRRSSKVLNLAGRLSVIPRAFHQPINEVGREIYFTKTLQREMEEELLGREDLDLLDDDRRVDPLHPARSTAAMRALQEPGVCRMECTGFGINATNGNYELSALIVVDDPAWWDSFGHLVEANWESSGLQRYSSLDTLGLTSLIRDPKWSSGGLFELLQGLRRLAELEPEKVAAPAIEVMP